MKTLILIDIGTGFQVGAGSDRAFDWHVGAVLSYPQGFSLSENHSRLWKVVTV
mgnify:CR=1 FL=1